MLVLVLLVLVAPSSGLLELVRRARAGVARGGCSLLGVARASAPCLYCAPSNYSPPLAITSARVNAPSNRHLGLINAHL